VRYVNQAFIVGVAAICSLLALASAVSFLFNRRRKADGWFALLASSLAVWHLSALGFGQVGDSRLRGPVALLIALGTCVAAVGFTRSYFRLKASQRHDAVTLDALCMIGVWALLAASMALQLLGVSFVYVQPAPVACLIALVTQALLLLRQHTHESRALNVALEDRLVMLQQRNRDVNRLNEELRLRIRDRSVRLADALGRIGRLSSMKALTLPIGTTIGQRYRIVRQIGAGGMGAVYEVERTPDGQHFALKTLLAANSGTWLARLAREAQAVATVVHPNVVGVVDVDVDASGMPYLVMELVKGESLGAQKARFGDPVFAREVALQLAGGLAALHAAGIVHRDLTPANVLIEPRREGRFCAKIVDFGIARVLDADADATAAERSPRPANGSLTRTGWVMGTPFYMAPELATGVKNASPSCDLWSLGVVAYQLGCGKLPFAEPPVNRARDGAAALPEIDAGSLAEPLRAVVERCLLVEPSERPTAAEVAAALS
jgi:hypothetical protein